jgi:hypothetical protein
MFHKNNEITLCSIIYFLVNLLESTEGNGEDVGRSQNLFRTCWPLFDTQTRKEFKKVALDYLKVLEEAGHIPRGSSRPSLLQSPCGLRVEELVWHLSTHVLHTLLVRGQQEEERETGEKMCGIYFRVPNWSNLTQNHPNKVSNFAYNNAIDASILLEQRDFRRKATKVSNTQDLWRYKVSFFSISSSSTN